MPCLLQGRGSRSVHLMYSNDRRLGWKGGAWTHPKLRHSVPQGHPFSMKFWLTTGSQPEVQEHCHYSLNSIKMHTMTSVCFHHTQHNGTTHFLWGGAKTSPHNHQPFTAQTGHRVPDKPSLDLSSKYSGLSKANTFKMKFLLVWTDLKVQAEAPYIVNHTDKLCLQA